MRRGRDPSRCPSLAVVAVCVAALCPPCPARSDEPDTKPTASDSELNQTLDALAAHWSRVTDLRARFHQEKTTPLLREPLVSSGTVRMRGDAARWDTAEPEPFVMRTQGGTVEFYYPRDEMLEVYDVSAYGVSMSIGPMMAVDSIREMFEITLLDVADNAAGAASHVGLTMVPRDPDMRGSVGRIDVLIDRNDGRVIEILTDYEDSGTTRLWFEDVETNVGLEPEDVALEVPEGTTIRRVELGGSGAGS